MPIIIISARSDDRDKVEALDAGADDYITKPFSVEELLARVRAVTRRLDVLRRAAKAAAESAGKKEREAAAKAAAIAAIREEAEKREAEAEQAGREAFEAAKADIEAEKAAIGAFLSERTDDLAAQFNERLILLR